MAYAPAHRCKVPICETEETYQDIFDPEWLQFAIPLKDTSTNYLGGDQDYNGCLVYNQSLDLDPKVDLYCQNNTFLNITSKCEEFVYDKTYFDETLSTALNLVCDNQSYRSLLGTILIIGLLFGSLIGGRIGDQFGRKKACFGAIALIVPTTIIAGHVESYYAYAILHFITMGCLPVIWVNCYVYSTEIFTPKWRYIFIGLYEIPIGYYIFNLIGYLNRTWTGIHIWVGIVTALILPVYFILPESVRWLAQNNKETEAMEVLKKVAKINQKALSTEDEEKVRVLVHAIAEESHQTEDKLTPIGNNFDFGHFDEISLKILFTDMFRNGHAIKSLILCLAWITSCISFYALSLNTSDLSGDIMLNFFLARTSGFGVAIIIVLVANFLGRTLSLTISHTVLGWSCIGLAFIPSENRYAVLVVYILANIVASVSFNLVYLMTCELYPTNLRSQAVGSASTISRVFCAVAPYLGLLAKIYRPLPMLVIGVVILISAVLSFFLPETYRKKLPQTMENARELKNVTRS